METWRLLVALDSKYLRYMSTQHRVSPREPGSDQAELGVCSIKKNLFDGVIDQSLLSWGECNRI